MSLPLLLAHQKPVAQLPNPGLTTLEPNKSLSRMGHFLGH